MRTVLFSIITSVLLGLWISACAQDERPRQPFDHDILAETFGYGPDTPSLVDFEELYQGCPSRDCIPSIENPKYIPADEAYFLADDDLVMALDINRDRRAFPVSQRDFSVHPKAVVFGFDIDGRALAVTENALETGSPVSVDLDGRSLEIIRRGDGSVSGRDRSTGKEYHAIRLFWFAWYTFNPDTIRID